MADYKDMLKETLNNLGEMAKDITDTATEKAREFTGTATDFAKEFKDTATEKAREFTGAAAEKAEVWLTLRGEHDADLNKLFEGVLALSEELAKEYGLTFAYEVQDVFPATENDPDCAKKVLDLCDGAG